MSELYFASGFSQGIYELPEDEIRHIMQVMRHQPGDVIRVTDGFGNIFETLIIELGKRTCRLEVVMQSHVAAPPVIHLAIAPTKNMARMEWAMEKLTET